MSEEDRTNRTLLQSLQRGHQCFCKGFDRLFRIDRESDDDGSRYDATRNQFLLPVLGLTLYALPATIAVLTKVELANSTIHGVRTAFVGAVGARPVLAAFSLIVFPMLGGVAVFLCNAARSGGQDTDESSWPNVETMGFDASDERTRETLLTEYTTLAAEARYRDRLLLRTGYFSLAGFAALMAIFVEFSEVAFQAGIPMVGSILSLAFAIAVNSYKDARDPLWDRMRLIELHPQMRGVLTSFHTIRTDGERRLFDHLSLSGYIMNLQLFFLLVWVLLYFVVALLAFLQITA